LDKLVKYKIWTMAVNQKTWRRSFQDNLSQIFLMLALFFNPFGFDVVQYSLILLTGNLWKANFVLYFIAVVFFGLYIYFRRLSKKN
jgi:hypothetical protein